MTDAQTARNIREDSPLVIDVILKRSEGSGAYQIAVGAARLFCQNGRQHTSCKVPRGCSSPAFLINKDGTFNYCLRTRCGGLGR
jgi:hypothetical protein